MTKPQNSFKRFLSSLLKIYRIFRSIVINFFFLFFAMILLGSIFSARPKLTVPQGAALVFAPQGTIVEEGSYTPPIDSLLGGPLEGATNTEVLLQDVLDAINLAAQDPAISSLVLELNSLQGAGFSKLQNIGAAIATFRQTGKKVYALADSYSQGQYYLASYADEIILNPLGGVDLEGFSAYQTYYGSALKKIGVNMHIFRVGEFKSAVEPYERDNMSDEAKLANSAWLGDLWEMYINDISREREISPDLIEGMINNIDQQLAIYAGDTAELSLQSNLVDSLLTRSETLEHLVNEIGSDMQGNTFKQINSNDYLLARSDGSPTKINEKIGLIIASGTIYDGNQRAGNIGGDSLAALIKQARLDDSIKALVLRIDSGGGSAFASEIIRSEILEFKQTGKPFIASMGSVAASGGYWIASPADQIWASPSTITGSIGIFAIYPTFENTFDTLGIHTDGVGTTDLAGSFAVGRNLPPIASNALQLTLQNGYDRFLNIVSEGRGMTTEEVDNIAQGRVWSGQTAQEIGLVDHLGDLPQAISAAAELASLTNYDTHIISIPLSPAEQFIRNLSQNIFTEGLTVKHQTQPAFNNTLLNLYQTIMQDTQTLLKHNDPRGMYLQCFACDLQ